MVDLGAALDKKDSQGNTPLHQLISIYSKNEYVSFKVMKILVQKGADTNSLNSQSLSPLLLAVKKHQKGAVRDILKLNKILEKDNPNKFDLNMIDKSTGLNALYLLLKFSDIAESVFLNGGNIFLDLPPGYKRSGIDAEAIKTR